MNLWAPPVRINEKVKVCMCEKELEKKKKLELSVFGLIW
jgi:hypothetical protein